ncbi:hypothetical protein HGP17_25045 [Rhizobium sp. P38BS-XIX]|uniref:hypothetical protein n=1 Tax=Rhizobium sp. P38BS-XIX TaxID=2726740 RepID=UPI0014566FF4|nr:hypothetical protein [Rhizobium sp. P38BS-XIX]NLS00106.1 hypothetical protein [Rhizobium sp. P38BS-XIX]
MSKESAGIAAFSRIFSKIAEGDVDNVASLIESEGIVRSTAFDVVKRMETSGLIARQADGRLTPGNKAGEFAYAGVRLAPLFGRAQTLLPWLREKTNASVTLLASDGACLTTLLNYAAKWDRGKPDAAPIVVPIRQHGVETARLRLSLAPGTGPEEARKCEELAVATAKELQAFLCG